MLPFCGFQKLGNCLVRELYIAAVFLFFASISRLIL